MHSVLWAPPILHLIVYEIQKLCYGKLVTILPKAHGHQCLLSPEIFQIPLISDFYQLGRKMCLTLDSSGAAA
jgi:hypothetical protein